MQTNLESGSTFQEMSSAKTSSGQNRTSFSPTQIVSPGDIPYEANTDRTYASNDAANEQYLQNKQTIGNYHQTNRDDDENSHTVSDVSRENSEDDNWANELDIVSPIAIGDGVQDKDSEDVLSSMKMFFKLKEKCSNKIKDRLAKIVNESMRTRIGETKRKDFWLNI